MKRLLLLAFAFAVTAGLANAGILTTFEKVEPGLDDNHTTWDMFVDTDTRWVGSVLDVQLDSGAIFQDTFFGGPNNGPPSAQFIAFQPSLAFDTFFEAPTPGNPEPSKLPSFSPSSNHEGTNAIHGEWFDPGNLTQGKFRVARLTLSNDAVGTFFASSSAKRGTDTDIVPVEGLMIAGGQIAPIPEPASMALLILGAIGLVPLLRRRKK